MNKPIAQDASSAPTKTTDQSQKPAANNSAAPSVEPDTKPIVPGVADNSPAKAAVSEPPAK